MASPTPDETRATLLASMDTCKAEDTCPFCRRDFLAALAAHEAALTPQWQDISTAPEDPDTYIWVYCPPVQDLPELLCPCKWHPDAGFCVDELRTPTLWLRMPPLPTRAGGA